MDKFDSNEIKDFYENVDTVWPENDNWHIWNQKEIKKYINTFHFHNCKVLNAGSGGNDYGLDVDMYHVDIAENKIKNTAQYVVSSIEKLPFEDNCFDVVICVGSVINYCDAVKSISELGRVLKSKGLLILEFENSYSFEFKNTKAYKQNAAIITTSYFNKPHKMWVYSLDYICRILSENNITYSNIYPFHILSSFAYFYTKDENKSAKYTSLDKIFRHIPIIRKISGNIILTGTKKQTTSYYQT